MFGLYSQPPTVWNRSRFRSPTDYGTAVAGWVIGKADARTKAQPRVLAGPAVEERRRAFQRLFEACVDETTFKLVANAQVHRQPAANLPVVLNVVRHLPGDAALFLGRADPPQGEKIGRRQRRRATGRRGTRNPGVIHAEEN